MEAACVGYDPEQDELLVHSYEGYHILHRADVGPKRVAEVQ